MRKPAMVPKTAPTVISEEMARLLEIVTLDSIVVLMATIGWPRPDKKISKTLGAARLETDLAPPIAAGA